MLGRKTEVVQCSSRLRSFRKCDTAVAEAWICEDDGDGGISLYTTDYIVISGYVEHNVMVHPYL